MGIRLDSRRWRCGDAEWRKREMWVLFVDICLVEFESPNLRVNTRVEPKNQYIKSRRALESKVNQFQSWICYIFLNLFLFLFFTREKRKMQCTIPLTYDFHVLFSSPEETPLRNWGMTQWGPNHRKKRCCQKRGTPRTRCLGELDAFTRKSLCGLLIYISFPRLKKYISFPVFQFLLNVCWLPKISTIFYLVSSFWKTNNLYTSPINHIMSLLLCIYLCAPLWFYLVSTYL